MVVLEVLLDADALQTGMALAELSRRCQAYLLRSPELFLDLVGVRELPDPRNTDLAVWRRYWEGPDHPIAAWTGKIRKTPGRVWFAVDGEQFRPRIPVPEGAEAALVEMTRELVDARLAQYRRRRSAAPGETFEAKVLHNRTDPILKLPEGEARARLPVGTADVRLHDGEVWRFKFVSHYCNVAHRAGSGRNELPDLLRGWFGPSAGQPGTDFHVRFSPSPDGLWVEPIGARVIPFPERGRFVAFPSLQAAAESRAEVWQSQVVLPEDAVEVRLPLRGRPAEGLFAVRATGDSMDGGAAPIHDGDWVLLRYARGQGLGAIEGRVALVAVGDPDLGASHLLKRIVRVGAGHVLHSDNPAHPDLPAAGAVPIALLVAVVRPEELAPAEGCPVPESRLAEEFGLTEAPTSPWSRVDGGLFFLIDAPGLLLAPDRLRVPGLDRRPGETAFVLTRLPDSGIWRYAGIGRWSEVEAAWGFPGVDFATWRALGSGRSASRTLPAVWQAQAEALAHRNFQSPFFP